MDNHQKVEKFNYYEVLLFKFTLVLFGLSFALWGFALVFLSSIPKFMVDISGTVLVISVANLLLTILRLFKYLLKIISLENNIGIMRTAISLFLSPITTASLLILMIIMGLSGCTIV